MWWRSNVARPIHNEEKAVLFVPREDLFENPDHQADTPTNLNENSEWDDAFEGMQKLNLFEDETQDQAFEEEEMEAARAFGLEDAQDVSNEAATLTFDALDDMQPERQERHREPEAFDALEQAPVPSEESQAQREQQIGAAVFQSLFADNLNVESERPSAQAEVQLPGQSAQPITFDKAEEAEPDGEEGTQMTMDFELADLAGAPEEQPVQETPPVDHFTPVEFTKELDVQQEQEAAAPQRNGEPAGAVAPAQAASVPLFQQNAPAASSVQPVLPPNPVPRRSGTPKPINWHVDMHARIEASKNPASTVAQPEASPVQQPAVEAQPVETVGFKPDAQLQEQQQQEEQAWKPILESAMMGKVPDTYDEAGTTKVFTPAASSTPQPEPGAEQPAAEEKQTVSVQFDTASMDLDETGTLELPNEPGLLFQDLNEESSRQDIASNIAATFDEDEEEEDFDAALDGLDFAQDAPIDAVEMEEPAPNEQEGELYEESNDAPDGDDEEAQLPARRVRAVQDYPGGGGGNGRKVGVFVLAALAGLALLVAIYFLFLQKHDTANPAPPAATDSSTSVVPDSAGAPSNSASTSVPASSVAPVAVIPRDEWYMRLVNRDNVISEEECNAIETTDVGGVPVDSRAADAFNQLLNAASQAGYNLTMRVGYRTYATQAANYTNGYTDCPAGASEHNLGLGADIFSSSVSDYDDAAYRASAEYQWLVENAATYGFIERYPAGSQAITGFDPEPWHWRYVGTEQAQLIKASGLTLEQYLAQ